MLAFVGTQDHRQVGEFDTVRGSLHYYKLIDSHIPWPALALWVRQAQPLKPENGRVVRVVALVSDGCL